MPYIKKDRRAALNAMSDMPQNSGELNYLITRLVIRYVKLRPMNYQTLSEALSALEAAKLEYYRRVLIPYEDLKKEENGDVF